MPPPLLLLGEAFGSNEARLGFGFVGASGVELLKMLGEAGVIILTSEDRSYLSRFWQTSNPALVDAVWRLHPEVYRTNVFNLHPLGNDIEQFCGPKATALPGYPALTKSKYVHAKFQSEIERLADELCAINPNLVVCLGNTPLWALAGTTGISKLRGTTRLSTHTVTGIKILPTYHPAAILRQWENRPISVADLIKAGREAAYPEIRRPEREVWIEPTLEDLYEFERRYIADSPLLSCDIETSGSLITCIGFAPTPRAILVVPFFDARRKNKSYWPTNRDERDAWGFVKRVLENQTPKLFQNGLYDIAFLLRSAGIAVRGAAEDTMLLHHALQPESLKGLGFLGSIYSDESAWKQERRGTKTIKRDE